MTRTPLSTAGWFGKGAAGFVLGFVVAVLVSAMFAWFGPGGITADANKTQFNMWMVAPIWALLFSFVFLFRRVRDAWIYLGAATIILAVSLVAGRMLLAGGSA